MGLAFTAYSKWNVISSILSPRLISISEYSLHCTLGIIHIHPLVNIYQTHTTYLHKHLSPFHWKGNPLHMVIASLELILHKQRWFIIIQNYNYVKLPAILHMGEEWLRGVARVEPPVPLLYANWAPEKFREMILYASIHLPSNNYVSQQGAQTLPNTANTHTHSYTAVG